MSFHQSKAVWPLHIRHPIHQWPFSPEWQHSREETEQHTQQSQKVAATRYNFTASSLPDITVGTRVAVQNTRTRSWDTYGLVTFIGPHRQYHACTHGKGKGVGMELSFSLQACSSMYTSWTVAE